MASISTHLQKILDAVYGEEVRTSIHDAIKAMNEESTSAMQYAATAKDSAKASASSAESFASTAKEKADAAVDSAALAKKSADAAKASEQTVISNASDAVNAAKAAAESEQKAAASESVARQKAQNADASKVAAAQSAAEASESESKAKALRDEVVTLSEQAKADKEAADASKEVAQAARDAAKESEQKAKSSEETALSAQSIVIQAKTDAESANTAAQEAKRAAEEAQLNAEVARDSAADSASDAAASALSAKQYSGKPPKPDRTTKTWWIWDDKLNDYVDSHIGSDIEGPQGVGISDIKLTSGDHTPGTADIYTVELTNGTTYNISVWNGRNGEGAGDVLGKSFDLVIPAAGWSEGKITVADDRLLAFSAYQYFISADKASRKEFQSCKVQPEDITTTGFIVFTSETDPTDDLTVHVVRFELSANG